LMLKPVRAFAPPLRSSPGCGRAVALANPFGFGGFLSFLASAQSVLPSDQVRGAGRRLPLRTRSGSGWGIVLRKPTAPCASTNAALPGYLKAVAANGARV